MLVKSARDYRAGGDWPRVIDVLGTLIETIYVLARWTQGIG